jgi:ribulose-5-phosphate 4-epimerase/fuculose-1-phosphate aldolase
MSPRQSVLELARRAAHLGWAVGDGGDIAVRNGARVLVTPARPDKSHIYEEDLLLLEDGSLSGNTSPGASVAVPTALPVMLSILSDPQVGAVVHGHGVFPCLRPRHSPTAFGFVTSR